MSLSDIRGYKIIWNFTKTLLVCPQHCPPPPPPPIQCLSGGTVGYSAEPGLISLSVYPSVCLSVHTCRLGIQRKKAQAKQIYLAVIAIIAKMGIILKYVPYIL